MSHSPDYPLEENHQPGDFRCFGCGKLLAKSGLDGAGFEIKCHRCGLFNSILQEMREQVIVTDPEGVILFVNQTVTEITGYTIDEVVGATPALWGKQMSPEFYAALWREIKTKKRSAAVEVINRKKDGELYHAQLRISPVLDVAGEIRFFVGIETPIDKKNYYGPTTPARS